MHSFMPEEDNEMPPLEEITAMACFLLLHSGYDTEVMIGLSYGYGTDTLIQY